MLQSINSALSHPGTPVSQLGVPEARHFLYKCKATAQFWGPVPPPPYQTAEGAKRLLDQYRILHHRLHAPTQPLKLLYLQDHAETMLGWVTNFLFCCLFVCFCTGREKDSCSGVAYMYLIVTGYYWI